MKISLATFRDDNNSNFCEAKTSVSEVSAETKITYEYINEAITRNNSPKATTNRCTVLGAFYRIVMQLTLDSLSSNILIGIVFFCLSSCNSSSNNNQYQCVPSGCNFNSNGISIYSTYANIAGDNSSLSAYCSGGGYLKANAYAYNLPNYIAPAVTVNHPGICNGQVCGPKVILDRFNESYTNIDSDLANIANEGYSAFWILPVQASQNVTYGPNNIFAWYSQYQALDYGNLNSYYGTEDELSKLIHDSHHDNLQVFLDVSFHQMAEPINTESNGDFSFPQSANGPIAAVTLNGNVSTGGQNFVSQSAHFGCWVADLPGLQNGNPVCGNDVPSKNVLTLFTQFAELTLNSNYLDADGFRIDELNIDNGGIGTTLISAILNDPNVNTMNKTFFGEYPSSSYDRILGIKVGNGNVTNDHYMEMLNFPFLNDMVAALNPGGSFSTLSKQFNSSSAGGVNGTSAINMALSQDTAPDAFEARVGCGSISTMDYYNASLAYAIILAINPGTPFIYADAGANVNTPAWNTGDRSVDYENVTEVKAGVYFHNITQYQPMNVVYVSNNVLGLTRGLQYFFIENKSTSPQIFKQYNSMKLQNFADGQYVDLISGELITVKENVVTSVLYVPPESAMFFVPYQPI